MIAPYPQQIAMTYERLSNRYLLARLTRSGECDRIASVLQYLALAYSAARRGDDAKADELCFAALASIEERAA